MNKSLFGISAMALVTSGALAADPRSMDVFSWTEPLDPPGQYVPCLNEYIVGERVLETSCHEFETTPGTYHIVDNWRIAVYYEGLSSGNHWVGHGRSPFQLNLKLDQGQVVQWVSHVQMMPLEDGGPRWVYENEFKVTVNANGDLVVEHVDVPEVEGYGCLGPTK